MNIHLTIVAVLLLSLLSTAPAVDAQEFGGGKPIPLSRHEMLQALEALKHRQARLPLPPLDAAAQSTQSADTGSLGVVNNARMRRLYLPEPLSGRSAAGAGSRAGSKLPYQFATELFWIVSRVNNCQYCLGHQENKLKNVGVSEASLLALDTDWSSFSPPQHAAFAFARQLTHVPHTVGDQDIDQLRTHFSDDEILEIAYLVGRYNSTNRWTDSLGIPQEDHRDFASGLTPAQASGTSRVAVDTSARRPGFSNYGSWHREFEKQRGRRSRLRPSEIAESGEPMSPEEALLASIPAAGEAWVQQLRDARLVGSLPQLLKDKIAFVAAFEDHAWYMQHLSHRRLLQAGLTEHAVFALAATAAACDEATGNATDRAALSFAKRLTSSPQSIGDADIEKLKEHFTAEQIAEIVYHTGLAAIMNRVTETAQLEIQ